MRVIYCIRHIPSGRVYVGSSGDIRSRINGHRSKLRRGAHPNEYLQRAWSRDGEEAFAFQILEEVGDDADLLAREDFHIWRLGATDRAKGFNLRIKAESNAGLKPTDAWRKQQSELKTGVPLKPGHAEKISAAKKGKPLSEATRVAAIAATKGKPLSEAHRAKVSAALRGRPKSAEWSQNIRAGVLAAWQRKKAAGESWRKKPSEQTSSQRQERGSEHPTITQLESKAQG